MENPNKEESKLLTDALHLLIQLAPLSMTNKAISEGVTQVGNAVQQRDIDELKAGLIMIKNAVVSCRKAAEELESFIMNNDLNSSTGGGN